MIENLTILLCKEVDVSDAIVFPCEDEIFEILTGIGKDIPANSPDYIGNLNHLKSNQPIAVVWHERKRKKWYVGFYLDSNTDGTHRVDHLEPSIGKDDIQDVEDVQIVPQDVKGYWDFCSETPFFVH